ncbi:hypothetical protein B9Z55_009204 [Caenorhabditis nigoni]|nr:hypothetical protein B9Z55_009204 [Caenorhabditis nigoni]
MRCVKFPPNFTVNVTNEEEAVQLMLFYSDNMLRMYGTARELLRNLGKFQNFSLSHRLFQFDYVEPYTTVLAEYKNMDDVSFLNKADIFCLLQNLALENLLASKDFFENPKLTMFFLSLDSILLKSYEERIIGVCEFIKCDDDWLLNIQNELSSCREKFLIQNPSTIREDWSFENALEMFKKLLPVWNEHKYPRLEENLRTFFDFEIGSFNDISLAIQSFASYFSNVISKNPEIFLPYDKETNPNCPITIRVFESHGVQFVMKSELFNAINIRNPDSKEVECKDVDGKLMTMSYEKVRRKYKDWIANIEFIKYPIQRTDHKAVPIMTPSGGYCILAVDFLFEILNELIFSYRVFQKIGTEHWDVLKRNVLRLSYLLSPHHKSIIFITLEEQEKRKKDLDETWKYFDRIPAKYVRNAKADGFTVQNLKNELANLGLTEMFPEIQDYAESVYTEVLKAKKEEFLRTCDLFKAVEKCLLHCIFKRLPTLHLFLHTQNACHLLPNLKCDFCVSPNTNRFKDTHWKEQHYHRTLYTFEKAYPENTYLYEMTLPDGSELTTNYYVFHNLEQIRELKIKYFIYDTQDMKRWQTDFKNVALRQSLVESLYNLDAYQQVYPERKFYIRSIPSKKEKRKEASRVFAEEVLDLIPVVLRQQNTPISENDDRLVKYRKKWETNDKDLEATVSLAEIWYILEEFDVDKTRIMICPDPVYELTMPKMVKELAMRTLNVISPWGEQIMRSEQAVFHIFQVVYCSVNWTMDSCETQENCLPELKDRTISFMKVYSGMEEGTYVTVEHVESVISQLKNHCSFRLQSNTPSPLVELQKRKFDDMISKEEYISNCRKFGLSKELARIQHLDPFIAAHTVRINYLFAWLDELLDFETLALYDLIMREIGFRAFSTVTDPDPNSQTYMLATDPRYGLNSIDAREQFERYQKTDAEKQTLQKKKMEGTVEKKEDSGIKKNSEVIMHEGEAIIQKTSQDYTQKLSVTQKALEVKRPPPEDIQKTSSLEKAATDIQKISPIKKLPAVDVNQSKCCTKCLRTSEMCNEAKKELKSTQNQLEKYEKKAKRTEEVEIQMREMEAEMKKMKKEMREKELEVIKNDTEIEYLKNNVLKLEAKNAKMQLEQKNHSISQNGLLEKITDLSDQLKNEKERIMLVELQLQQSEENLKSETREKERGFEELRAVLSIMSNDMESLQRDNRNLREQIASIPEAPPTPTVPESPSEEQPNHHRFALFRFQRIKDSLCHKKQLKQAKEMVEKLKSTSNLVEVHQIADYEYYQFEAKLLKYVKEVELNIQRIKETCDVSMVTPLPENPEFSKRFVNLYWRIINNQPITPSEIEVSDTECFICTEEMVSDQKTLQCEKCKKVTHYGCASQWLKINRWCPHCREKMLDPGEFPNLGQ